MLRTQKLVIMGNQLSLWAAQYSQLVGIALASMTALAFVVVGPDVAYICPLGGGGSGG
jgi:hypothetical protein